MGMYALAQACTSAHTYCMSACVCMFAWMVWACVEVICILETGDWLIHLSSPQTLQTSSDH